MATLTGRAPKDTYGDLMQVSNGNAGVDGTLRFLSDGKGGNSTLKLSSSTAQFTTTLLSTGLLTTTAGITSGSNIISDTDSTDSLGSTSVRWLNLWVDNITMGGAFAGATGTFSSTLAVTGLTTIASLKGTGAVTITDILDEDNMASDSATKLATQQSIKAYVDAQVDTADTLAEILAIGNTTGGTDVSVSTDDKVQFRDAAIYINSSTDGQLDIVADTEIQIAATTIDINGAVNASGEIIAASLDISGDIDVDGTSNLDIVDIDGAVDMATTLAVAGNVDFNGDLDVDGTANLDNVDIDGTLIVSDTTTIVLANKIQFRDAAIYLNSSADGQLDIVADTEIQIATTTVDLNGNLDVSGTALVTGVLTATATSVHTGGITSGGDIISDTDSTDSIGSTGVRWLKGWYDTLQAGTLVMGAGSITDTSGAIDFGNENLVTTGTLGSGVFTSSGDIISGSDLILADTLAWTGDTNTYLDHPSADTIRVVTAGAVASTFDSSQGLTVAGAFTATTIAGTTGDFSRNVTITNVTEAPEFRMIYDEAVVSTNEVLGTWSIYGGEDGGEASVASIVASADGTWTDTSSATALEFFVTAASAVAGTLALTINADKTAVFASSVTSGYDFLITTSGRGYMAGAGGFYGWTGDTDTYFDSNAANTIRVITGGAVAATFTNSQGLTVAGALSKGSGSFRIPHPLPSLNETHNLVYSFTESPQADLIHRGKVALVNGLAEVNIDVASKTTEGTFVLLCGDVQCFTTNETDWCPIRGSVSGNILTIVAQDNTCTDTISWMVIGERKDQHMIDTDWTDDEGHVINEPLKPVEDNEE